jgi:hypothetical protein
MAGNRSLAGPRLVNAGLAFGCRLVVMSAIVASLLYWPAAIVVVALFGLFGVPAETLVTLGGRLGIFSGMLAWWGLLFLVVLPCAVCAFPWNVRLDGFRRTKKS